MTRSTCLEALDIPSLYEVETIMAMTVGPSWMDPLFAYFIDGHLSEDEMEAQWLIKKASHYILHEGKLYRTSYIASLPRYLQPSEAAYALQKAHEGMCSAHQGAQSLAHKILR